jgi:prephenate dehydratase
MKVAIQGISACFHEMAAREYFGKEVTPVECMTFQQLCESVKNGSADFGVMAIENSIAGSLLQNYALLMKYGFHVIGEVYLNIQMNLMALPGQKIEDLHTVQSHPIALSQCSEYLWSLPHVKWLEVDDTALAAKDIANNIKEGVAAVANVLSAEMYGLEILEKRIETHQQNFTRFLIISTDKKEVVGANKASTCLLLKHEHGSLAKVLNVLSENNINLTKIQSVPIVGRPYEYKFHIDMEWTNYDDFTNSIEAITPFTASSVIIGEYKKGTYELL